ncbi:580_t:CDS:10 [Funneliformis mosseae]|uniref:580_t:CDS:1 n=1 Tax=Funneliformis mosseae TaxID=27381 RepID=A0A9N8WL96_FUNMO|nr:580_t:CDS:10 [Funneliformis mosseae]
MNRTPNSNSTQKNYAQAAAQPKQKTAFHTNNPHHPNQHHQQVSQQNQSSGSSTSTNFSSSANGKPNNTSQTKPQAQHISNMGNGNTGRSIKHNNAVQLPSKGHVWETAPNSFGFGTVNSPNTQIHVSPPTGPTLTSGGGVPNDLPTKGGPTFGTVTTATTQLTNVGTSATRANEIARTHSAPPLLNPQDSNNVRIVGQSGHPPNVGVRNQLTNIHQQQSMSVSHQQPSVPVNNSALHRKDSVSSTVSSNDGQQPYHSHQPSHHSNHSHTNQHNHPHFSRQQHQHHKPMVQPGQNITGQYTSRSRDKHISTSSHINPAQQPVPQATIPMAPGSIPMSDYLYYAQYPPHPHHPIYMTQFRPPMTGVQAHIPQAPVTAVSYVPPQQNQHKSKAIPIVDPNRGVTIAIKQQQLSKSPNFKKEEISSVLVDNKLEETDKESANSEDKGISKAIPIVDPAEKERKEREEYEKKEREEHERLEREKEEKERKEAAEKARKEQEEKERQEAERKKEEERLAKEREERERKEAEEKARKEQEEKERQELERKKEEERLAREKEEKERKEAEEKARKEQEEKERQEAERKKKEEERLAREKEERERKEAEEKARKEQEEKERQEAERKKEEERLAIEKLERERKEAEEKARKVQEEKERQEAERKKEEERLAQEKKEREAEEKIRKVIEDRERQEAESKEKEESAKTKTTEVESTDKKDLKKEEKKIGKGNRPGPLDLSRTTSAPAIPSAPLSALGSARLIDDLTTVSYPPHIKSPDPKLNSDAEPGKFKYDRIFLMQFMDVCKEKPEHLPALEAIGLEETKDDKKGNRQGSRTQNARITHKNSPNQSQFAQMGEFKLPKTSEERFLASSIRIGTTSVSSGFVRNPLGRTGSGSTLLPPPAMTASPPSPGRASSGRRDGRRNGGKGGHQFQGPNFGHEQIVPLERTENRWVPASVLGNLPKATEEFIPIEVVQRKVKALLNKLTLEKFDSISDQIIDYANKSRDEKDGRILKEVIRLIFEKSCDEPNFCAMYAQLCRKMMERVDPVIVDENVKNTEGKFVQGGTLFRKYLLNRCQEDFEKGWKVNVPVPANEKGEPDLMSDEYYAAAKAKRHGLGLIRFIGELFKLNMLTERIMHECIKKLLTFQGSPEEEEMESLCKLMNTVGEQLDHANGRTNQPDHAKTTQLDDAKARQAMDSYFNRMEDILKHPNMTSRIKFMIMDIIDLRSNSWKPRRDINAPKTIAEIHEDAAKQKEEADFLRRTASSGGRGLPKIGEQMSRSGSGRRDHRSDKGMSSHGSATPGNDGWINVGGGSQRNNKVGDLTKFGSIRSSKNTSNVSLAPGGSLGNFTKAWSKSDNKDREDKSAGLSRTNSTSNMYSVLESSEGRKSSEFAASEPQKFVPMERKKLALLPRTIGTTPEESQSAIKSTASKSVEAASSVQTMPEEVAVKKIDSMIAEYFSVLDIKEVLACLKEIPTEFHAKAIEEITNKVIEKKQADVDNVINLFKEIISSETCDISNFKDGFKGSLEFLMEIGADAPMAYSFIGQLLYSTGLDFRDITTLLGALDSDRDIEKIVKGYVNALKNDQGEEKCGLKINEFDIKSLFPKKNKDGINKFLEDLGLGSLK